MELKTFKVVNFLGLNKNVELKFQDNKLIMVGENGSGKSQLMRMFTLFFNDLEGLADRNFEKIIANINDKEIVVIKDKLKKDYSNFDEEYIDSIRKQIKDETNGVTFAYLGELDGQQYCSVEDTFLSYLNHLNLITNQKFLVGESAIKNANFFTYDYFDAIKSCINLILQTAYKHDERVITAIEIISEFIDIFNNKKDKTPFVELVNSYFTNGIRLVADNNKPQVYFEKNGEPISFNRLENYFSFGETRILNLLQTAFYTNKKVFYIIDGIEYGLCVGWQQRILNDLYKFGTCEGFYANTHSPFVYKRNRGGSNFNHYVTEMDDVCEPINKEEN